MPRQAAGVSTAAEELGDGQILAGLDDDDDDLNEDPDDTANKQPKRKPAKRYLSTCEYLWEHVVLDECQHVKSIRTRQHQSIALLRRNSLIGLTGTPMWNKVVDLFGYFSLLAGGLGVSDDAVKSLPRPDGVVCSTLPALYKEWSKVRVLPRDYSQIPYALLSPSMLVQVAPGGNISPQTSHACFPFLFRASIMMRSMGDTIVGFGSEEVVIGKEIPPIRVMTLEVRYAPIEQIKHNQRYKALIQQIAKSEPQAELQDGQDDNGRLNMGILRQLSLLGFNLKLDDYLMAAGASESVSEAIGKIVGAKDHGFIAFFEATSIDGAYLRPVDAIHQAHYLIHHSPRLKEMLRILDREGAFSPIQPRPRFLIFSHWPIVCWIIEMVLQRLCIKTVSITAAKTPEERALAAAEFNNPNSACQVLNTTYNTGGTGLNLHACCAIVILMEPAPNFNLETQAIGRVHRIGQAQPQKAYRIFQDHTINRYMSGNNFRKMLPQLAAQFAESFSAEMDRRVAADDLPLDTASPQPKSDALEEICEDYLRSLAGVCDDFPYYQDLLEKKDLGLVKASGKVLGLDTREKVEVSTRASQARREKGPITPAKRKRAADVDDDDDESESQKRLRTSEDGASDDPEYIQIDPSSPLPDEVDNEVARKTPILGLFSAPSGRSRGLFSSGRGSMPFPSLNPPPQHFPSDDLEDQSPTKRPASTPGEEE